MDSSTLTLQKEPQKEEEEELTTGLYKSLLESLSPYLAILSPSGEPCLINNTLTQVELTS